MKEKQVARISDYLKLVGSHKGKDILEREDGRKIQVICSKNIPFKGIDESEDMHKTICKSAPKGAKYYKLVENLPYLIAMDDDYIETNLKVWFFK